MTSFATTTATSSVTLRPRRSVLYMPGSNDRALEKARGLDADALVLDLEDAVAPAQKNAAREAVVAAVNAGGYGKREMAIRINSLATSWGEADLISVASSRADAVCVPKVESAAEVLEIARIMDAAGAPAAMQIWAMIETPLGVLNVNAIAGSHPRLRILIMGTSDLAKELRVPHTPERLGFITSLSLCVLAARAHNLDILDGVYLDLSDEAGYQAICEQGRALGFDGKTLIHPKQLAPANEVFGPSPAAVIQAEKIIAAFNEAQSQGLGVVVVDGKLVENLHVDEAQRTLAIAAVIAAQ